MPKVTVTIEVTEENLDRIQELVAEAAVGEEKDVISPARLRGKPAKSKKKDEDEEEETEEDSDEDETEEDEETEEDADEEEESDEDEEDKVTGGDLTKLKLALKVYAGKHSKAKAVKLLGKYADRSDNVKKSDLPKLMAALKK